MINYTKIVILGSGRSGTSYITRMLKDNGVHVGDVTGGTCENLDMREINDRCLKVMLNAETRSKLPYGIIPPEELNPPLEFRNVVDEYMNWVDQQYEPVFWKQGPPVLWVAKDPRTTLLNDMWTKHFDVIVGMYRNPVEVVASYKKLLTSYYEDPLEAEANLIQYWKRFNKSLLHVFDTTDKPKFMFDFNQDINVQIKQLEKFLDFPLPDSGYDSKQVNQKSDHIYDDPEINELYNQLRSYNEQNVK